MRLAGLDECEAGRVHSDREESFHAVSMADESRIQRLGPNSREMAGPSARRNASPVRMEYA